MRLTKRVLDEALPADREYFLWDDDLPGFGVRVYPSGRKVWVVQWRKGRRTRRMVLGHCTVLAPDQARKLALRTLAEVEQGRDPRAEETEYPSLRRFARQFLEEYLPSLKPSTQREYRRLLEDVIVPALGSKRLDEITRQDVARFQHAQRDHPAQANRALAVLSRVFSVAAKWGYAPEGHNPCRGLERFKEEKRQRYLSLSEIARLGEVLRRYEAFYPEPVLAVRLLLLTGCRLNEILSLRWEDVDSERRVLVLKDAKTGPRQVVLSEPARQLLAEAFEQRKSEWVIPGRKPEAHLVNFSKFWRRLTRQASIEELRIHDLRHTTASVAVGQGISLYLVGGLLGHRRPETTARYSHLADDPLRAAAESVGREIAAALEGREAEIVELKQR